MVKRAKLLLIVEGGADNQSLDSECRRAFQNLLEKAGLRGRLPRVNVAGGRGQAFRRFKTALSRGERAMLLVDSESRVEVESPWQHVRNREGDRWVRPQGASDDALQLMAQFMETWFLADPEQLIAYFGARFLEQDLPSAHVDLESLEKSEVERCLNRAARNTVKKSYDKGRDSFKILHRLDPGRIRAKCFWGERFFADIDAWASSPDE